MNRKMLRAIFGAVVVLWALAGVVFAVLRPPLSSVTVPVLVQAHEQIQTQALIAGSAPVLATASRNDPVLTYQQLLHHVKVTATTPDILAITASAKTAADAQNAARAAARSYVSYVNVNAPSRPGGRAVVFDPWGMPATGTTLTAWVAELAGLGALAGVVLGLIVVVAIRRSGWRPRG